LTPARPNPPNSIDALNWISKPWLPIIR